MLYDKYTGREAFMQSTDATGWVGDKLAGFTPLVFSIYVSLGSNFLKFYSSSSQLLSEKKNLPQ